uniref:Rad60/SUMO-like domain-containing protein n=1 Tax=Gorilla gorilla gorilla TaxID=9595 RepID=A0A2I2ZY97_GORGO
MANEKPKEGVKTENNDHINLKVAGQDGSVVQFKIKRHTPLSKLMKAYCERQGFVWANHTCLWPRPFSTCQKRVVG